MGQAWGWLTSLGSSSFDHACEEGWEIVQQCVQEEEQTSLVPSQQSLPQRRSQKMRMFFILGMEVFPCGREQFSNSQIYCQFHLFFSKSLLFNILLYLRVSRILTQFHTSMYSFLMKANHLFNTYLFMHQIFKCLQWSQSSCLLLVQG